MSKRSGLGPSRDATDSFLAVLDNLARVLFWAGVAATTVGIGFLAYYAKSFGADANGTTEAMAKAALSNIDLFQRIGTGGALALGIASCYLFWDEEILGPIQLLLAGLLYFAPAWLPLAGITLENNTALVAAAGIQSTGQWLGICAFISIFGDIYRRITLRAKHGARADQMKYGKDVKAEKIENVFLGKCWQLPYCRKFIREKCPIFHSKRTCWKERVGCMCEEKIIGNAMKGEVISKDALAAAVMIPRNPNISMAAKIERCRHCVIYNEHQRQKYKLFLPITIGSVIGIYFLFKPVLMAMLSGVVVSVDSVLKKATFQGDKTTDMSGLMWWKEILLVCFMLMFLAYMLKLLEFFIFKIKV